MKLFFLHIRHRDGLILDEEGSLHPDFAAAQRMAIAAAREMIGADLLCGLIDLDQSIAILDDTDAVLGEVPFSTSFGFVGRDGFVAPIVRAPSDEAIIVPRPNEEAAPLGSPIAGPNAGTIAH